MFIFMGYSIYCSRYGNGLYRTLFFFCRKNVSRFYYINPFFFSFLNLKKLKKKNFLIKNSNLSNSSWIFFLSGGFALQQYSLLYTDVANAAIFTIFYVLIVPAISYFLFSKKFIGLFGHQFLFV